MDILIDVLIFWAGALLGIIAWIFIGHRFREYGGTIHVTEDPRREKTVYTLELDDYPDELRFKKEVLFRIDDSPPEDVPESYRE